MLWVTYSKRREIHEYSPVYLHLIDILSNSTLVVCGFRMLRIKVNIKAFLLDSMEKSWLIISRYLYL